jgi:hypothetical protein
MMAKERDDRYATPQQVIEDVEQVLRGEDPQNAALEAGKSSVRVSAKRYEKLQGRYVQQQGVRRTTGASALVSAGPGPGKHVVPGADLPSARGRTRSGVVDALGPADLAAGRHSPARGNEARVRRQTTGSQQPVGAVRLKPDDKQRAPSGEPRKLSRLSIVVCAAGVLFFLMGLLLALWPRSAPRDAPNKPGTTKGGITAPAGR